MPTLTYPIALSYLEGGWDAWSVVREFVANALDEDPDPHVWYMEDAGLPSWVPSQVRNQSYSMNDLIIANRGRSFELADLLLGHGSKVAANAIGQFHEGMKIALVVLTRMNKRATIYSGNRMFYSYESEMAGVPVLAVDWEELDFKVHGTVVVLHDWEAGDFRENFLKFRDPEEVLFTYNGRAVLNQADPDIFVKGVWVKKAVSGSGPVYRFGYNLTDVDMNRDRQAADEWQINYEIGKIWASCDSLQFLSEFFWAIKDDHAEQYVNLGYKTEFQHPDVVKQAFQAVHGDNAVIKTGKEDSWEALAIHNGAKVVKAGTGMAWALAEAVGADHEWVAAANRGQYVKVTLKSLTAEAKKNLSRVQKAARSIDADAEIEVYHFPPTTSRSADADLKTHRIRISVNLLQPGKRSELFSALVEELAHIRHHTVDGTHDHAASVLKVAGQLLAALV